MNILSKKTKKNKKKEVKVIKTKKKKKQVSIINDNPLNLAVTQ